MSIKIEFDSLEELEDFAKIIGNNPLFESPVEAENDVKIEAEVSAPIEAEETVEMDTDEESDSLVDVGELPYNERYKYDFYKCYLKTPKGRSGRLLLTGSEALDIIPLIQRGMGARRIWNHMQEFYHDEVTLSTLKSFIKRYKEGKLNDALTMYCENWRVNEDPSEYIFKGGR